MAPFRSFRASNRLARRALLLLLAIGVAAAPARAADPEPRLVGAPTALALDSYDAERDVFDANYEVEVVPGEEEARVAVWVRWADFDGSRNDVVGRLFDAEGRPLGARFRVNADVLGSQQDPAVTHGGGQILITWTSNPGSGTAVHARLLDGRGRPVGEDVEVADAGERPDVALGPSGRGLVVWDRYDGQDFLVFGRVLSPQGRAEGAPFPLSDLLPGSTRTRPVASADGRGRFFVVWRSWEQVGPGAGIFGRWFDAAGTPEGPEFRIHQQPIPSGGRARVAVADDGSSVVVWTACDFSDPSFPCEVRGRLYAADGLPRGPEIRVSPANGLWHENPAVAMDDAGHWAVASESCHSSDGDDRYDCRLTVTFLDPAGEVLGAPFELLPGGRPVDPSVTAIGKEFVVGWDLVYCEEVRCGTDPPGVYIQRFRLDEGTAGPPPPPDRAPLTSTSVPGFRFWVRIGGEGSGIPVRPEAACIPETLCVSGAIPGRSELFLRIVGPKPNGYLWPTIVKFTTSEVEIWIEQTATGERKYYRLEGASPGSSDLPGLFDRTGFPP